MASIAEQAAFGAISRSDSNLNPPAGLVYHQPGVSTPGCQDDRANTHPCLAPELNAFELFGSIEDVFRFLSEILRMFQRFLLVRNIANVLSERYEADISWQAPCSKRLSDRGHAKRSPTLEYSQNSSSAPCLTSCLHSPLPMQITSCYRQRRYGILNRQHHSFTIWLHYTLSIHMSTTQGIIMAKKCYGFVVLRWIQLYTREEAVASVALIAGRVNYLVTFISFRNKIQFLFGRMS